jgi:hypothetical protein
MLQNGKTRPTIWRISVEYSEEKRQVHQRGGQVGNREALTIETRGSDSSHLFSTSHHDAVASTSEKFRTTGPESRDPDVARAVTMLFLLYFGSLAVVGSIGLLLTLGEHGHLDSGAML